KVSAGPPRDGTGIALLRVIPTHDISRGFPVSHSTKPIWANAPDDYRGKYPLRNDLFCDVCVVGGGIAGLSIAYELLRQKMSVIVLEGKHDIAAGETGATSAHLASVLDDRFAGLESIRGLDSVR